MAINFRAPIKKLFSKIYKSKTNHSPRSRNVRLIKKYREFDTYKLGVEIYPRTQVHIPKKLPSEPENGITYHFGPSGYLGKANSNYCLIPTAWGRINNYCHWNFSEVPVLYLAFSSPAKFIVLPSGFLEVKLPFQTRWFEVLKKKYPDKIILPASKRKYSNALIPVNHDTSTSEQLIGKCPYKYYHHSRATPYAIQMFDEIKSSFDQYRELGIKRFYINRTSRRLKNETEVQAFLSSIGYAIINLEELTLDDQVHLFTHAEEIIGFHGSGLANLLFCNTNGSTKVFEIVDKDCVYPSYLDGLVIPKVKATRTYFHMVAHMKNICYEVIETEDYFLNIQKLASAVNKHRSLASVQQI